MAEEQTEKHCPKCDRLYPLTDQYFYRNNKKDRVKQGWQSNCKSCWREVNRVNKAKRKVLYG